MNIKKIAIVLSCLVISSAVYAGEQYTGPMHLYATGIVHQSTCGAYFSSRHGLSNCLGNLPAANQNRCNDPDLVDHGSAYATNIEILSVSGSDAGGYDFTTKFDCWGLPPSVLGRGYPPGDDRP